MQVIHYHNNKKQLTIPENWEELTGKQFIALAGLLHSGIKDNDILLDKALFILSGKSLFRFLLIHPYTRKCMQQYAAWVFKTQQVTAQLIPEYKGLYGPEKEFDNLLMAEFHHSEAAFHQIVHEQDTQALDELVAILYREPKKDYDLHKNIDGDRREAFSWSSVEYTKKIVAKWPPSVKQAIAIWYAGCRKLLMENYQPAFGKEKVDQSGNYYEGLFGMIRNLSGERYGTFTQVQQIPVHTAFMEIVLSLQEAEELKRKYPDLYD